MDQLTIAVFGGTGFIGSATLDALSARGHRIRALARTPARLGERRGLVPIQGDVTDAVAIDEVIRGSDAVVSCLGTRRDERRPLDFLAAAMTSILATMRKENAWRLVAISGAGITVPGERKPFPHNAISALVRRFAYEAVEMKQREFDVVSKASDMDWTAVRPTRVMPGPPTGHPRVSTDPAKIGLRVTVGDLAEFIAAELTERKYSHRAPFISS